MATTRQYDERLKEFAGAREAELLKAVIEHGSPSAAGKALGLHHSSIIRTLDSLELRAAKMGFSPRHDMTKTVPDGFVVKGVSTYYDDEGKPRGQWVKSAVNAERQAEIFREACAAMAETLPRVKPAPLPAGTSDALCNLYTFTDYHLGMLAWGKETGADWDLKIAERTLVSAFAHMIDAAPKASTAFIAQLGDFLHSDGSGGMLPVTPLHSNILDQDGRYSKIVGVAIRVLRRIVDFALERHQKVVVLMAEGNHDLSSSVWLRAMFRALYENEPRVTVIDSESPYYAWQHGTNMLGFHHGHLTRKESMPLLFASKFPAMWGATTKRVIHTGHQHHKDEKEHNGVTVVQHRTLAANDAHSARHGYVSERSAQAITYHAQYGEVARNTVVPEMFEAA
ncbi:winged helix-turn-helix domain-containing protein [Paraburkholderia antibiotica]|uniref:Winged helix-turn-helix domain-containing protein n=1 Tax=Paraburkholderia antibiotica TaxID=2728839 RepID=A0A7Y0A1S8_9BURK|nr:winged helix-turn-helix domain-containing protein [Paraburkholderia antibiotica]NML34932.1 winged helix-turn-helix domain-containing protein [Paraburkholderia antibiotica]